MRIIGDNSEGFANEREIRDALNSKLYDDINPNLRHLLDDMFRGYNLHGKWVHAHTFPQRMKPDFYVTIDGIPNGVYVSVKKGTGNSLHQESLENFIHFLETQGVKPNIIDALKKYHFSDETIDNTGSVRYDARTFSKMYPGIVKNLNHTFNEKILLKKAINRFIFKGNFPNAPEADYLYHGTVRNGVWASKKEIYDYIDKLIINGTCVSFGPLTYQAWNKNLSRNPSAEHKRLQMQVKWGNLEEALTEITSRREDYIISGTYEGDLSEKASIVTFNKNPFSPIFNEYLRKINMSPSNVLLIRVTTKQFSKLSNQKVNTRADAYAIEVLDNRILDLLEENNFYLDEEILSGYENYYHYVDKSGISIKKDDSENYTLLKLTPNSFYELFGTYELGYGASIFCKRSSELHFNIPLLAGWKTTIEDLQDYFETEMITETSITTSLELCQNIKNVSVERIKQCIDNSPRLQAIIFNGKDIYDEPYSAYFFMQNNTVRILGYVPYNVTTGSGRSHGNYSIILKPKSKNVSIY